MRCLQQLVIPGLSRQHQTPWEKQRVTHTPLHTRDLQGHRELTGSLHNALVLSADSDKPCHKYKTLDDTRCDCPC